MCFLSVYLLQLTLLFDIPEFDINAKPPYSDRRGPYLSRCCASSVITVRLPRRLEGVTGERVGAGQCIMSIGRHARIWTVCSHTCSKANSRVGNFFRLPFWSASTTPQTTKQHIDLFFRFLAGFGEVVGKCMKSCWQVLGTFWEFCWEVVGRGGGKLSGGCWKEKLATCLFKHLQHALFKNKQLKFCFRGVVLGRPYLPNPSTKSHIFFSEILQAIR